MVCTCAFPGCSNKTKSCSPFKFHRIPSKDVDLRKLWLAALKRDVNTPPAALRRIRVCSAHFADEDYIEPAASEKGQRFLKERAVPSSQACTAPKKTSTLACKVKLVLHGGPEQSAQKPSASGHSLAEPASKTVTDDADVVGESEASEASSDPGDVDSDDNWDPEEELSSHEELQAESDEELFGEEVKVVPKHRELCTDCGTFFDKRKPHVCEHKIKPFSCNICGKRLINEIALKAHSRIHDANYEYPCKYCHVKFKTKAAKIAHQQIHLTQEKPYKCPDCSETFAKYPEYRTHLEDHRGLTQLKCHICGMEFRLHSRLRRHLVVHTGEKPFKCAVCERGFNQAGNLKSHMRLHTGEKPFRCQHCDQGFNHNVSLKSHVQRYHAPGCEYQPKKASKRKRNSGGDSQAYWEKKDADSWLAESEQDTDDGDDVQPEEMFCPKTNATNSIRPKGRPKKTAADGLFQAEETQGHSSDTNAAKIKAWMSTDAV
ncbi:zinc finger protein 239-like [Kryptolebias marmoratus]|uniref:Zinc finger protein 239-like n=1 Tax=Kryptolebias marmoratus TaxID=37003 RepID=A0A3Q3AFN6_KRYMA|nr:zinc finger protein 239-like [Kryptolebias marmoratus]